MMFKKNKLQAKKKNNTKFISVVGFLSILCVFGLSFVILNKVSQADMNVYKTFLWDASNIEMFTTLSPEEEKKIELAKILKEKQEAEKLNEEQKTNVLIVWRGWYWNDAPELTDSIILASIHKWKNHITMLSIPRDLFVHYGDENSQWTKIKGKINGLYVHYLANLQDEGEAMEKLKEKITEITGERIDYYVNLDFDWFIKLVDSVWWVQIDVPETLVDNQYPDNNNGYDPFILRKWNWLLEWKVALKYVRSRKNTGWDFWRSHRQQQVITALKDKILWNGSLSSPTKIKSLYNIFKTYVTTDVSLITATSLLTQIKLQDNTKVYSSWLNTSCNYEWICEKWWYLYYPQRAFFWWTSVLLWESADHINLDSYDEIKEYADIVFNSPQLFDETYKISIFSKLEDKEEAQLLKDELKKIWFTINVEERIWNVPEPSIEDGETEISLENKDEEQELNLEEYNLQQNNKESWTVNPIPADTISSESSNLYTKVITNWVDIDSETRKILIEYLDIEESDIIENIGWPKYARDPNTQIEIIYTQ